MVVLEDNSVLHISVAFIAYSYIFEKGHVSYGVATLAVCVGSVATL